MGKNKKQAVKKQKSESTDPETLKVTICSVHFEESGKRGVREKQL